MEHYYSFMFNSNSVYSVIYMINKPSSSTGFSHDAFRKIL